MNPKQRPTPPCLTTWEGLSVMVDEDGKVSELSETGLEYIGLLSDPRFDDGWGGRRGPVCFYFDGNP